MMMRKVVPVLVSVLFLGGAVVPAVRAETGVIKLGIDSAGEQNVTLESASSASETVNTTGGASIAFEFEGEMSKNVSLGFGFEIQSPRELENVAGEFRFMPIYALIRLHPELTDLTPYFIGQAGFALFSADDRYKGTLGETKPGGHVGIGFGLTLDKSFNLELLFTADSGKVTYPDPYDVLDYNVVYSKTTLSVGFRF